MPITIGDTPLVPGNRPSTEQAVSTRSRHRLLSVLEEHDVPAIGFVNESKPELDSSGLSGARSRRLDPFRMSLLEEWLRRGSDLRDRLPH